MDKKVAIALGFGALLIVGALLSVGIGGSGGGQTSGTVRVENGIQIIEMTALRGYSPRQITAQGGLPTILRVETKNTFDCSSALVIPKVNFRQILSPNGMTDVDLGAPASGTTIKGTCSMGMYGFEIGFN